MRRGNRGTRNGLAVISFLIFTGFVFLASPTFAAMGNVTTTADDLGIQIFGSLKTYPHFIADMDFNDDNTGFDFLLDESGIYDDDTVTVRNEFRLGVKGGGENWTFMAIMESDFALDKGNTDRGVRGGEISKDLGMSGEDFGIEKLDFTYDFTAHGLPVTLQTGWNTKWLDIETGGVLFGDDHPYIGLKGNVDDISWEAMTFFVYDDAGTTGIGNADKVDHKVYTAKCAIPVSTMKVVPFYAYSDNDRANDAEVHYIGFETFGKLGILTPRAEFVYANGEIDDFSEAGDADVSAWAGFVSLEANLSKEFNPYIGSYYMTGDDDPNDDDVDAFNPITNISRYTPTFGMENAFIYHLAPVLGTHLYSNDFTMLGQNQGYGGISNSAKADSPGFITLGVGSKGAFGKWSYKVQFQNFWLEEEEALEKLGTFASDDIDDDMGWEFDLRVGYNFTNHFWMGNVISVFDPGDAIEDLRGDDFDETAFMDTIEIKWSF